MARCDVYVCAYVCVQIRNESLRSSTHPTNTTAGMAREEYVADSASSQVFWLLFESDLTPAGKNLLDGRYTCFGYTIEVGGLSMMECVYGHCVVPLLQALFFESTHTRKHKHTHTRTNQNADLLAGVKEGDIITSAKVLSGLENLKTK